MVTVAVKITRKGQVTIPKQIRERLKATAVYFDVVNDEVVVRPVRSRRFSQRIRQERKTGYFHKADERQGMGKGGA